ncbi:hypothetical protein VTK73DRAFT_2855 [Phialemonium thermophilum]|uniref:3-hydroxyisobutyryl-CoA hydrolase n=1 Tax=Phialemonium thermophilum TaxID=223376 RepID=A0ABR3VN89_9PEZI
MATAPSNMMAPSDAIWGQWPATSHGLHPAPRPRKPRSAPLERLFRHRLPAMEDQPVVQVEYRGRVAVIAIDNVKKLNALDQMQYYDLSQKLREVATHDEVYITVLIGRGRFFSA